MLVNELVMQKSWLLQYSCEILFKYGLKMNSFAINCESVRISYVYILELFAQIARVEQVATSFI